MERQAQRETVIYDYEHRLNYRLRSCLILIFNRLVTHVVTGDSILS